jgi:hypothetical protein
MLENMVLRKLFGPEREEVAGNWINYTMRSFLSPRIVRMTNLRSMR